MTTGKALGAEAASRSGGAAAARGGAQEQGGLKRKAAVAVLLPEARRDARLAYGVGIAIEGEPGYVPWVGRGGHAFATYEAAKREADSINRDVLRLSDQEAFRIVASSMRASRGERRLRDALETVAATAEVGPEDDPTELRRVIAFMGETARRGLDEGPLAGSEPAGC